ncbi:MAG: ribosome biogenesis GTPase Der, partial [Spirochaetales bacterium]|nr:ribosome biogenesis GTPase Der [Spirochaetales bacterium]
MNASISLPRSRHLPRIAIVGRPNVGKSTLFNRLVGSRRTITDPTPGVTRDPIESQCRIGDREVILIDTGGYQVEKEGMAALVSQRSLDYLHTADVIMLLVEVTQLTPEDEDFIAKMRHYSEKLILVVNKADNEMRENDVWEFHSLGFRHVLAVSAEHARNLDRLRELIVQMLPVIVEGSSEIEDDSIHLAILGKPNTGKSTLLNKLLGFERAIVSPTPGTTRDVIEGQFEYKGTRFTILDTAGIRRKKAVTDDVEYYS